jgi:predicted lipoprotein with Yx(FWY)xxD motif
MMRKTILLLAAAAITQTAFAEAPKTMDGRFVDGQGRTLYTFDNDKTPGQSACSGGCAKNWPAATADANDKASGDWTIINGADGAKQWAYKGKPLYRFASDSKPGDMAGDGFKGVWHTAKP